MNIRYQNLSPFVEEHLMAFVNSMVLKAYHPGNERYELDGRVLSSFHNFNETAIIELVDVRVHLFNAFKPALRNGSTLQQVFIFLRIY